MRGSLLWVALAAIAGGILLQALLAGLFISGAPEARMTHLIVGAILPYLAIVPMVSAWRRSGRGEVSRGFAVLSTVLLVLLWVQEALGHMPFPVTTAIHVPLGVALFALAAHLAVTARQARRRTPEPVSPVPT